MASSTIVGHARMTTAKDDTKNEHINRDNRPHESIQGNLQASPATGIDSFNDSGFCDCEDDRTNPYRHDYTDWILFNGDIPNLNTDNFFADLDASTKANHGSIYDGMNNESNSLIIRGAVDNTQTVPDRRTSFYDPVHEAVQQALHDFEIRSQPDYSRPSHAIPILSPLDKWTGTYERHESIAYRLEQPPNPPRPLQQQSRQPSQWSSHQSRSH